MSRSRKPDVSFLEYVTQLHRAVHALGLFVDANFGPALSQPEALILVQLLSAGPSTINDVHRAFLHRRSTLTSVLDRLETKGFIARRASAGDRRAIDVKLTREGRKIATAVAAAFCKLADNVDGPIDEKAVTLLESTTRAALSHE